MSGNGGVSARESDAAGPSARASSGSEPLGLVRLMSQRSPQNTAGQRSKQARVADWSTAFLTVDKTRGGAGNKYYWCNEPACHYSSGALLLGRKGTSSPFTRAEWVTHVLTALPEDTLRSMGLTLEEVKGGRTVVKACVNTLHESSPSVVLALQCFKEATESKEAEEQRRQARQRDLFAQRTLEETLDAERRRRCALKVSHVYLGIAAYVASGPAALRTVENPEFCDLLQTTYKLGWAHGHSGTPPEDLKLIKRRALTETYIPRVAAQVDAAISEALKNSSQRGGGAYGVDGWKDTQGDELYVSTFTSATESHLIAVRDTSGVRKNEAYFLRVVMEDLTTIFGGGGKVTIICTDGAMADWHDALRGELRAKHPNRPILVLTCAYVQPCCSAPLLVCLTETVSAPAVRMAFPCYLKTSLVLVAPLQA
jgi:hypothetical protein